MPQSSLAIAPEIDAWGDAKSARNVFHCNTQKLLGEEIQVIGECDINFATALVTSNNSEIVHLMDGVGDVRYEEDTR